MENKNAAQQQIIERYEDIAKRQGLTLVEYLERHPADYLLLKTLGVTQVGARVVTEK